MTDSHKHQNSLEKKTGEGNQNNGSDSEKKEATEIKNAHASGIGSLARSEENQLENLSNNEVRREDNVY